MTDLRAVLESLIGCTITGVEVDDFRPERGEYGNLVLVMGNRALLVDCESFCIEQGPHDA